MPDAGARVSGIGAGAHFRTRAAALQAAKKLLVLSQTTEKKELLREKERET
jgi:hypothetical protein